MDTSAHSSARAGDSRVTALFRQSIDSMGGIRRLVEERRLDWLPDLLRSADILVMQEEEHRRPDEIADLLLLSADAVENALAAPHDQADAFRDSPPPAAPQEREFGAGVLVKQAYLSGREPPSSR